MSEALILASTNPQYDNRLFIELPVQYMKIPSSEHGENIGRTWVEHVAQINCSECQNKNQFVYLHNMFWACSELAIFMYWTANSMNNLFHIVMQKRELLKKIYLHVMYTYVLLSDDTGKKMLGFWLAFERSIFQIFWKVHCCTKFLFIELDTSNFGYMFIFQFCWTVESLSKIGESWY